MLANPWVLGLLTLVYLVVVGVVIVGAWRGRRAMAAWRVEQARQLPELHRQLLEQRLALQEAGWEIDRSIRQVTDRLSVGVQDVLALLMGRAIVSLTRQRFAASLWAPLVSRAAAGRTAMAVKGRMAKGSEGKRK